MLSDVAMKTLDLNLLITRVGLLAERMVTGAARRARPDLSAMSRAFTSLRSAIGDPSREYFAQSAHQDCSA